MTDHAVIIVGAGPTGLMLAGELALAGIDVALVERRPDQELAGLRAGGLHARTIEALDLRGIAGRFLAEGYTAQVAGYAGVPLDISDFPTRHPYGLALRQNHIERILADWVGELGVPIHRRREITGLAQDEAGVAIDLVDGAPLRAEWLVGCDGGRSVVRKAAGIDFSGWEATTSNLIAQVKLAEEPEWGIRRDAVGIHALSKPEDGVHAGVLVTERQLRHGAEPTLRELKEEMAAAFGSDYGAHGPVWLSRFTDAARQAEAYRSGRVLLAGDAAHVHPPDGGQGLNTGMQDAVNLGWKLAQVVRGQSPERLLDTYHAERHPVAARAVRNTVAQVALRRADERTAVLRDTMAELLAMDEPRRRFAGMMSGLDIAYDLGEGHPLLGRRMPDMDLATEGETLRASTLLHDARPLLLDLGTPGGLDVGAWSARVRSAKARHDGPWELPVLGEVPAPAAVLVRPDGHVAWVGNGSADGLREALETWFGPA